MSLLYHMMIYMGTVLKKLLEWIFPVSCFICDKGTIGLCTNCSTLLPNPEHNLPDWILPMWSYKNPHVRDMILSLKKFPATEMLKPIGRLLYQHLHTALHMHTAICVEPIIIPIPISKTRFKERGYNQSELIAESMLPYLKHSKLHTDIVYKIRDTKKQSTLHDKTNRTNNAHDVFAIKNIHIIKNRDIIIIDDVVTTGSTLSEARDLLLRNGARNVYGLTIAH